MIYLSNKKILANIFVSTTNDHPVGLRMQMTNSSTERKWFCLCEATSFNDLLI